MQADCQLVSQRSTNSIARRSHLPTEGFGQLAEMVSHRRKPDRVCKRVAVLQHCFCDVTPELGSLAIPYPHRQRYAGKRSALAEEAARMDLRPVVRYALQTL